MPARGARTTYGAFQTAAILHSRNAGPPFTALAMHFARRTPTRGRPTGRAPEAGIPQTRRNAIGAAIREISAPPRLHSRNRQDAEYPITSKRKPRACRGFQGDFHDETSRDQGALDAPDTNPRHKSGKARIA